MIPYVADPDFTLLVGDVRDVLRELPDESVDCCVTSPPYWGLRCYGHDQQIGLEATPELYVQQMVEVFRQVRRVLAPHGTCFLNLGDSYAGGGRGGQSDEKRSENWQPTYALNGVTPVGLKPKDLVGIPWRVAFALQQDGWYLRSDIVWSKPNPMPESVTDRPTKSHEYVFMLSKQPRYFFDAEAVREPHATPLHAPGNRAKRFDPEGASNGHHWNEARMDETWGNPAGRNVRSVWEIATQPYPEAHFATFPEALPDRCIRAGCPVRVCRTCGKASERIVEVERRPTRPGLSTKFNGADKSVGGTGSTFAHRPESVFQTLGWSDCGHNTWRPGTVLDPFMGSGTVALVARRLGRRSVGVELNEGYAALCARRLQQLSLLAEETA